MSSERSTFYVARNERLLKAQLDEARRAADAAAAQLSAAIANFTAALRACGGAGAGLSAPAAPARPGEPASREALDQFVQETQGAIAATREGTETAHARVRFRDLIASAIQGGGSKSAEAKKGREGANARSAMKAEVERIIGAAPHDLSAEEQAGVNSVIEKLLRGEVNPSALTADLSARVQRGRDRHAQRKRHRQEAESLIVKLRGLDTPEVEQLRSVLAATTENPDTWRSELPYLVEQAQRRAKRDADDRYARQVFCEALAAQGFVVQEGFMTAAAENDSGEFLISFPTTDFPEQANYAVAVRVDKNYLEAHVIRYGSVAEAASAEQELQDRAVEARWCTAKRHARSAWEERGVTSEIRLDAEPGAAPVLRAESGRRDRDGAVVRPKEQGAPG